MVWLERLPELMPAFLVRGAPACKGDSCLIASEVLVADGTCALRRWDVRGGSGENCTSVACGLKCADDAPGLGAWAAAWLRSERESLGSKEIMATARCACDISSTS